MQILMLVFSHSVKIALFLGLFMLLCICSLLSVLPSCQHDSESSPISCQSEQILHAQCVIFQIVIYTCQISQFFAVW